MDRRRLIRVLGLLAVLLLAHSQSGTAHPLGNFSISQYAGIHIGDDAIALRYFIDMAEIPTFQELQTREIPPDPTEPRVARYLRDTSEGLKKGLALEVDGRRLALDVQSAEVIFPPGVGDLPTLKMAVLFRAPLAGTRRGTVEALRYRDENFAARAGWKEVIAVGLPGVRAALRRALRRARTARHALAAAGVLRRDDPARRVHRLPGRRERGRSLEAHLNRHHKEDRS
jgi:hypothetical protein